MKIKYIILIIISLSMLSSVCGAEMKTATVFSVKGDAKVIPVGSDIGIPCEVGMLVNPGDWIRTGPDSKVTLAFDEKGENVIRIEEDSLTIIKLDGYFKMQLLEGKVYAILEDVSEDEVFRVLTPSVVAESTSSGWQASSDGALTKVLVVDGEAFVYGMNPDGTVKEKKHEITEGYERETKTFEEPGELTPAPAEVVEWFKKQVVEHHLEKTMSKEMRDRGIKPKDEDKKAAENTDDGKTEPGSLPKTSSGKKNVFIADDGEEVNILEYLYKKRLKQHPQKN